MRRSLARGLWQHRDFRLLWAGQAVSQFGSQITLLALPLTAALTLGATPLQMGLLAAAETLPFLLLGLVAGVWVDRLRRRPILLAADLGRLALLATVPAAALGGVLRIELLYVVALGVGTLTTFFEIAYQSYLPTLVGRADLVEGNSKLETTRALAQIAGPSLAGVLVQLLTAPLTLALDAGSFLLSALCLGRIRVPEPAPQRHEGEGRVWRAAREGLRALLGNRSLRALVGCSTTLNLAYSMQDAVLILYLTRDLGLGPLVVGGVLAAGNVGGLLGALCAGRLARRVGLGPTLIGSALLDIVGVLAMPLAGGPRAVAVVVLIAARCCGWLGGTIYTINGISLRQRLTPDALLGRVNAGMRFVAGGVVPLGATLGGVLGGTLGLRGTLLLGGLIGLGALGWLWWSPLRALRHDETADDAAATEALPGAL